MLTFMIGEAKVRVNVEGCISCDTRWSWRWEIAKEVVVRVGGQRGVIALSKCGDCLAKGEQLRLEAVDGQTGEHPVHA